MSLQILKCPKCSSYALSATCACGGMRIPVHPPKFSPEDKYAHYRRQYKEEHQP
jgi:H/ACA ribonucleoprotein complex subunit 3